MKKMMTYFTKIFEAIPESLMSCWWELITPKGYVFRDVLAAGVPYGAGMYRQSETSAIVTNAHAVNRVSCQP